MAATPLVITDRKQLFIDERFVSEAVGVRLVLNPPVQHPEPIIRPDRPWEAKGVGAYHTALREPDGRFRLWYGAQMKRGLPQEGAGRLCYAESSDGIHWQKPTLGLRQFQGSRDNNILVPHDERQSLQGGTIYRDDSAPPAERYRLWTKFRPTDAEMALGGRQGLNAMHSPDGLHWTMDAGQPNPPGQACDTQNMFFRDPLSGQWVGYTRVAETQHKGEAAAGNDGRKRTIGRITSPDFKTWSATEIVMQPDAADLALALPGAHDSGLPRLDFYTSCAQPYLAAQEVYLAFPSIYYHWGAKEFPATMDVRLLVSRDGRHWSAPGERLPFLRPGPDGSDSAGMVFVNPWLIPVGDELWFYYTGRGEVHGADPSGPPRSAIYRASLRRDGFVSLDAGFGSGSFVTPPVVFTGRQLTLNLDGAAGGWLQVALQDETGKSLPGYDFSDADTMRGNNLAKTVCWRGQSDLSHLAGRPLRLAWRLRAMKLYAFQFTRA